MNIFRSPQKNSTHFVWFKHFSVCFNTFPFFNCFKFKEIKKLTIRRHSLAFTGSLVDVIIQTRADNGSEDYCFFTQKVGSSSQKINFLENQKGKKVLLGAHKKNLVLSHKK